MNILVVDSDPIQIQSLARGLKGRGHAVVTATSKAESFSVLDEPGDHIDLILTDLNVPQLDAFELIRRARAKNELFPVIIMTTHIGSELKKMIRGESCIALIEKPFVLEQLLQEINRFDLSHDAI